MKINMLIRSAFEKELGQIETCVPPHEGLAASADAGEDKKERRGFCLLSIITISALFIVFLNTGILRSPLVIEWTNIMNLIPEDFVTVFSEFIDAINSSV
jgi:hypothetical protein